MNKIEDIINENIQVMYAYDKRVPEIEPTFTACITKEGLKKLNSELTQAKETSNREEKRIFSIQPKGWGMNKKELQKFKEFFYTAIMIEKSSVLDLCDDIAELKGEHQSICVYKDGDFIGKLRWYSSIKDEYLTVDGGVSKIVEQLIKEQE